MHPSYLSFNGPAILPVPNGKHRFVFNSFGRWQFVFEETENKQ